jgi:hypothetical protein
MQPHLQFLAPSWKVTSNVNGSMAITRLTPLLLNTLFCSLPPLLSTSSPPPFSQSSLLLPFSLGRFLD